MPSISEPVRVVRVLALALLLGVTHCVMHTEGVAVELAVEPARPSVLDARGRELRIAQASLRVAGAELEPCDSVTALRGRVGALLAPSLARAHELDAGGAVGVLRLAGDELAGEEGAAMAALEAIPGAHCALWLDLDAGEDSASMAMEIEREDRGRLSLVSGREVHLRLPLRGADGEPRPLVLDGRARRATIAIEADWAALAGIDTEGDGVADRVLERLGAGLRAVVLAADHP